MSAAEASSVFAVVAVWYLLLTAIWSIIQAAIEKRLAVSDSEETRPFGRRILDAFARDERFAG